MARIDISLFAEKTHDRLHHRSKDQGVQAALDAMFHYQLQPSPGVRWGPDFWAKVKAALARIGPDVTRRLGDARERGLIDQGQYDVVLEHMIWTEVDAELKIG